MGRLCTKKKQQMGIDETEYFSDQRRQLQTKKRLLDQLQQYREWLLQITILDPACGSGAFNCPELQGGIREIRKVYFENFRIPTASDADQQALAAMTDQQIQQVSQLQQKRSRFLRRLSENIEGIKVTTALQTFDRLSFAEFIKELKKQKIKLSLSQQDEWEDYFNDYAAACQQLSSQIAQTDSEIDGRVSALYGLTPEEQKIIKNR